MHTDNSLVFQSVFIRVYPWLDFFLSFCRVLWQDGKASDVEIVDYHWRRNAMTMKPPHPGETIKEEYLVPLGMSVNALAKALVPRA